MNEDFNKCCSDKHCCGRIKITFPHTTHMRIQLPLDNVKSYQQQQLNKTKSHNTKANDGGIKAHCAHLDSGSQPNESQTFNAKILDYQVSIPLYWILSSIFLCLRWLTRVLFCVLWGPRIKKAKNGKTAIKNQNKVISIRLDEDRKAFTLWQNVHIWFGFARTSIEHHLGI